MNALHIALATSKQQFLLWCKTWEIDPTPIVLSIAGESKDNIREALVGLKEYALMILPGWNKEEYVDEDYCNGLILFTAYFCPVHTIHPFVEDGKIIRWSTKDVDRQKYMLPYVPQVKPNQFKWTRSRDILLMDNYTTMSIEDLASLIGCSKDAVATRAERLHLNQKLAVKRKPLTNKKVPAWRERFG